MSKTDSDDDDEDDDGIIRLQSEKDHQTNIKTRLRSVGHKELTHKASTKFLRTSVNPKFDWAAAALKRFSHN